MSGISDFFSNVCMVPKLRVILVKQYLAYKNVFLCHYTVTTHNCSWSLAHINTTFMWLVAKILRRFFLPKQIDGAAKWVYIVLSCRPYMWYKNQHAIL